MRVGRPYYYCYRYKGNWVEAHPFSGAEEKELFKKGTRVRVYEKVNGYSRIGSPQSYQWIEDKVLTDHKDL